MKWTVISSLVLGVATWAVLALGAQDRAPEPRPLRDGQDRPRADMGQGMVMPPGPSSMIAFEGKIFIFANGVLYKVDPVEMKVVDEVQVVKPRGSAPARPDVERRPGAEK